MGDDADILYKKHLKYTASSLWHFSWWETFVKWPWLLLGSPSQTPCNIKGEEQESRWRWKGEDWKCQWWEERIGSGQLVSEGIIVREDSLKKQNITYMQHSWIVISYILKVHSTYFYHPEGAPHSLWRLIKTTLLSTVQCNPIQLLP